MNRWDKITFDSLIASPEQMDLLERLDNGYVIKSDFTLSNGVSVDRVIYSLKFYKLIKELDDRYIITHRGHNINKQFQQAKIMLRNTLSNFGQERRKD